MELLSRNTTLLAPDELVTPVPPLATASVPPNVIVPDDVIGPPEVVNPVEPPDNATLVTVPLPAVEANVPPVKDKPLPTVTALKPPDPLP